MLVLPPDHPLVEKERIRLSDVERYFFILLDEAHCLSGNIVSFCRERSFQPVAIDRTSQLAMVQELVSLLHGVSKIPAMARQLDQSDRRVYRSFTGRKPTRRVAIVRNPYRFQSRLQKAFRERLRGIVLNHRKRPAENTHEEQPKIYLAPKANSVAPISPIGRDKR